MFSILLQFPQLYEHALGYRPWWILMFEYNLCASIAVWLRASQRSRTGVLLYRSAKELSTLSSYEDWVLRYIRAHLYV